MRRIIIISICLFFTVQLFAQEIPARTITVDSIVVKGARPLRITGLQMTTLDTLALRDDITNSLADLLSLNSSIFIKSYGRATLSTASFRGTAPSHTQIFWNGLKLNSPMLGSVDFSQIPSFFIDDANLYHGASSVGFAGGGLGGAITLSTKSVAKDGFGMELIQGISSFSTFDEFIRIMGGKNRWKSSSRIYYASSKNDFKYTNIYKKEFVQNESGEITGFIRPVERNRNGSFADFHLLQEFYYSGKHGGQWSLSAWYMHSSRGVPVLNVDYRKENDSKNRQYESTFRSALGWEKLQEKFKISAKAGYTYTDMLYLYESALGNGLYAEAVHSQSYVNTLFTNFNSEYYMSKKWMFTADISMYQHFVNSMDRAAIVSGRSNGRIVGYNKARFELSVLLSAMYKPAERLGFALNIRKEIYGNERAPIIPALFAEYLISKRGNVVLKASTSKNFHYPSLNDLYFMPGGNDALKSEKGFTYDGGVEFSIKEKKLQIQGEIAFFNSKIENWIVWLPTFKGFWSPKNVKEVHSSGVELSGFMRAHISHNWFLSMSGNFTKTRSINHGDPVSWSDEAIGKQLVYIPEYSASATGRLGWKLWEFVYKWTYYSERFTTSSNEYQTKFGIVPPYFMSDISIERNFDLKKTALSIKVGINNLFNEKYESVLSRPMAGRNYGIFIKAKL